VRLLTEKGAWPEALAIAQGAQRRHPQAALGYRLEGDILMAQERAAQALKLYEQAFRLEPSGPAMVALHRTLQAMGRQQQATERMQQWLHDHPRDLPARLYLASALMNAGAYPAAVVQYMAIVDAYPQHVIALNDLAWTLQQMKDSRALTYAERAYKLANGNATVSDTLGWVLLEQGQAARALPLLKQASTALPAASEVRYHYANPPPVRTAAGGQELCPPERSACADTAVVMWPCPCPPRARASVARPRLVAARRDDPQRVECPLDARHRAPVTVACRIEPIHRLQADPIGNVAGPHHGVE
jgi:tetratricopeptide (TPR) repeat protein